MPPSNGADAHIVIVDWSDFQTFPTGGILTWTQNFVREAYRSYRVKIGLIGWQPPGTELGESGIISVGGYNSRFAAIGRGRSLNFLPDRLRFYARPHRWRRAVQIMGRADWYYCHSPEGVLAVAPVAKNAQIALHLHGASNGIGISRFGLGRSRAIVSAYERTVLRWALQRSDIVVATIPKNEFELLQSSGSIREGVPCIRTSAMVDGERLGSMSGGSTARFMRLICVGRLVDVKGIPLLLETVRVLVGRRIECRLDVVGDGAERSNLVAYARKLGVTPYVHFHGDVRHQVVFELLNNADIYVSGSYREGFSNALLEAIATGKPAVVSDVGSANEVVVPGVTGYVIGARDPERFADAVVVAWAKRMEMRDVCVETGRRFGAETVVRRIMAAMEVPSATGRFENGVTARGD